MLKTLQWEDAVGIALGVWTLLSPWVVGFSNDDAATMNAIVMGTILVLAELLELQAHELLEDWIDLVAGLWLIVSPFALGFTSLTAAAVSTMVVGVLTVLFAGCAMSTLDEKIRHWWHDHVTGQ